jgi:tetratricopeptide (TPR) repeat protein
MVAAGAAAAGLFFLLWWMLHDSGDEAPWVPAGLAASVVMLVAVAAREVVMRRAWTRYLLEQDRHDHPHSISDARKSSSSGHGQSSKNGSRSSLSSHSAALRSLQKQSEEADAAGAALPEAHLDAYQSCKEYLSNTEDALRSATVETEKRVALRAGQERARSLQRHHLVAWARGASRGLTHEAQLRGRVSDKVETAQRAMDVVDSALKIYPGEPELEESVAAIQEFIASVKVAHWVELAERAAFKGKYARAIDRYRDALFYVSREQMREETRTEVAQSIQRQIDFLRARVRMNGKARRTETRTETKTDVSTDTKPDA